MQKESIENWKPVPGYEDYEVSDLGNVRSLKFGKTKVLRPEFNRGYLMIGLWKNGKRKGSLVHTLVITAFQGPIPLGMQVNHKNEIKSDNRLENLELVTPKQNVNFGTRNERAGKSLSKALKGKTPWNKGKPFSEEARAKMSAARKGKAPWNKGKKLNPLTEEQKAKVSAGVKAMWERKRSGTIKYIM